MGTIQCTVCSRSPQIRSWPFEDYGLSSFVNAADATAHGWTSYHDNGDDGNGNGNGGGDRAAQWYCKKHAEQGKQLRVVLFFLAPAPSGQLHTLSIAPPRSHSLPLSFAAEHTGRRWKGSGRQTPPHKPLL